jgi:hypothetical protein
MSVGHLSKKFIYRATCIWRRLLVPSNHIPSREVSCDWCPYLVFLSLLIVKQLQRMYQLVHKDSILIDQWYSTWGMRTPGVREDSVGST